MQILRVLEISAGFYLIRNPPNRFVKNVGHLNFLRLVLEVVFDFDDVVVFSVVDVNVPIVGVDVPMDASPDAN